MYCAWCRTMRERYMQAVRARSAPASLSSERTPRVYRIAQRAAAESQSAVPSDAMWGSAFWGTSRHKSRRFRAWKPYRALIVPPCWQAPDFGGLPTR